MTDNIVPPSTIVLIHGLWVTPKCFDPWKERFQKAGHHVLVPGWPGVSDDIDGLRRDPSALRGLSLGAIADHLAHRLDDVVAATGRQPIIMGHSVGGLMTQLMLDRGYGSAGVAVDAVQTAGVRTIPWSVVRSALPVLSDPRSLSGTVSLTAEQFHYAMTNTSTLQTSEDMREALLIPGPGKPVWQTALHTFTNTGQSKVDYAKRDRAPLLFIAGGQDHIVPASVNRKNARKYRTGIVEVKEYPDRSHDIVGSAGWEEVADYALQWAHEHRRTSTSLTGAAPSLKLVAGGAANGQPTPGSLQAGK